MKPALPIAGAGLAIVLCCAGPAILLSTIAGIGLSALVGGIGAALIATASATCLLILRAHRRRCSFTTSADSGKAPRTRSKENR